MAGASGREAVEELRRSGALDALFERLDAGEVEMTGSQGLLPALLKEALERGLAAELSEHLGYEKGQTSTQARSNTRRGTTKKTVISEVGAFEIEVPRDRAGSFTPRLVRKGQRRLDGLDSMIISLYAGGMTVRRWLRTRRPRTRSPIWVTICWPTWASPSTTTHTSRVRSTIQKSSGYF